MSSLIPSSPEATMTSIELVEFINQDRSTSVSAETFSILSHSDFCKKAKIVLGEGVGKFSDTYQNPQNKQFYPIYRFPKREACLMAMSYSYDLQAKVFDRMTALESTSSDPLSILPPEQRAMVSLMLDNVAIKAVQAEQAEAIKRLEKNQAAFTGPQSFTALGYSVSRHFQLSSIELNKLGRKAATISKRLGLTVDKVNDVRFGMVNAYHVSALDAAIEEMLK